MAARQWVEVINPWRWLSPRPFDRRGSDVICAAVAMHVLQASLLLYSSATANATPLAALIYMFAVIGQLTGLPDLAAWVPFILYASAGFAFAGDVFHIPRVRLLLFLPQQVMLGFMAAGAAIAVWHGAYLDGTVKPWEHILADQFLLGAFFVVHLFAITRRAKDPNG
jgi:hypothetical protein